MTHPTLVTPAWFETFENFGLLHALTAGTLIASMIAAVTLGRLWRGTPRERMLRAAWAWFTIVWQTWSIVWWMLPANFDINESLPLHLCDFAAWVAPLALLTQNRTLRALLFFWGLGLSTQAFVSPVIGDGPLVMNFWLFWVGHTQIVGSAAYDTAVLGFRPRLHDYLAAVCVSLALMFAMMAFNLAVGTNYWFVGHASPSSPTIVDLLGPWPMRVIWMVLLALGVMALLWGIFAGADRLARARNAD